MSVTFTPIETDDEWVQLDVSDPGHGYMSLGRWRRGHDDKWESIAGTAMGEFLEQLRDAVVDPDAPQPTALRGARYSTSDLRALLRAAERAVVLAAAGTERYERVFVDPDEPPQEPLCVNCNLGSIYHQAVVLSERCNEHGHTPFGRESRTWEAAQEQHARDQRWWETMHRTEGGRA